MKRRIAIITFISTFLFVGFVYAQESIESTIGSTIVVDDTTVNTISNETGILTDTTVISDTTRPTLELEGANPYYLSLGVQYIELGARAFDDVDGDISHQVEISQNIDIHTPGDYLVKYSVSDYAGNTGDAVRVVIVFEDSTANGDNILKTEESNTSTSLDNPIEVVDLPIESMPAASLPIEEPAITPTVLIEEFPQATLFLASGGRDIVSGDVVSGILNVEVAAEGAKGVTVYIAPIDIDTSKKQVASLAQVETNRGLWAGEWDTSGISNGEYLMLIYVVNKFGDYRAASTNISIDNKVFSSTSDTTTTKLTGNVTEHDSIITPEAPIQNEDSATNSTAIFEECKTDAECQEVCRQEGNTDKCLMYVGEPIVSEVALEVYSMVDNVAPEQVEEVLEYTFGPGECSSTEECRSYCSDSLHDNECVDFLKEYDMLSRAEITDAEKLLEQAREERAQVIQERVGVRISLDTDADSIPDYDEINIYGTDPQEADTDKDGVPDGVELLSHTSPLINPQDITLASTSESIVGTDEIKYENPQDAGELKEEIFVVEDVVLETIGTEETASENLVLSGKAPANSLVTLFVFSTPIVVTMKTNEDGSWEYTLTRELSDGAHEAYVALTDSNGRIFAKSNALPFVKQAQAITVGAALLGDSKAEVPNLVRASYTLTFILIFILGAMFIFIGFRMKDKEEDALQ